jgi:hypothetical protein
MAWRYTVYVTIQRTTDVKPVQGYIAMDGTFFESKRAAMLYEAEQELRARIVQEYPKVELERVMYLLVTVMPELRRYCDAHYNEPDLAESEVGEASPEPQAKVDGGTGFFDGTEEDIKGVLKLPTGRHRHVPDLGHRPYAKEISDGGEVDGS